MTSTILNGLFIIAILFVTVLLIWEGIGHAETTRKLIAACGYIRNMRVTLDRYKSEKIEAQAIADHAIEVIAEARDITTQTVHEARIRELERAFVDRRQREKDLQDEIEKLTGGI
jgi:hypothetical protein